VGLHISIDFQRPHAPSTSPDQKRNTAIDISRPEFDRAGNTLIITEQSALHQAGSTASRTNDISCTTTGYEPSSLSNIY
jgi:hypothetical protein